MPQQAKKRFGVYQKACFQGKKKENAYTPKSLQDGCGEPSRAVLVYRLLPPIENEAFGKRRFPQKTADFCRIFAENRRNSQRRRDDNNFRFLGGGGLGAERKVVQNAVFRGKCHNNKILKVQIVLSRNLVVIAQAPKHAESR